MKVITLRDEMRMSWEEIGRKLIMKRQTVHKVLLVLSMTMQYHVWLIVCNPDLQTGERYRHGWSARTQGACKSLRGTEWN